VLTFSLPFGARPSSGKLEQQAVGLNVRSLLSDENRGAAQATLRKQILVASPVVVALLITEFDHVEYVRRYRAGIEAFVDRAFFADEIDECLAYLSHVAPPGED
jgi:hypothetical protein